MKVGDKIHIPTVEYTKNEQTRTRDCCAIHGLSKGQDYLYISQIFDDYVVVGSKPGITDSSFWKKDIKLYEEINTTLPTKWYIEVTKENREEVRQWFHQHDLAKDSLFTEGMYYHYPIVNYVGRCVPELGYTKIKQIPQNMNKKFAVTGSKHLLQAFANACIELGYKNDNLFEEKYNHVCYLVNRFPGEIFANQNVSDLDVIPLETHWNQALALVQKIIPEYVRLIKPDGQITVGRVYKVERYEPKFLEKNDSCYIILSDRNKEERYYTTYFADATKEEFEAQNIIQIGDYKAEFSKGTVNFGCQSFSKEEVAALIKFKTGGYLTVDISYGDKVIEMETLSQILKGFK